MRGRRAFTLIEVLLALALTGVVAVLVYGSLSAGLETRDRIAAMLHGTQSDRALRALVDDGLRNTRRSSRNDEPVFELDGDGRRSRMSFVTSGGLPPLASDVDWVVRLEATDSGLVLAARPRGVRLPERVLARVPGIVGVEIVADSATAGSAHWVSVWRESTRLPRGVVVTFWSDSGRMEPSLRTRLPLGGAQ